MSESKPWYKKLFGALQSPGETKGAGKPVAPAQPVNTDVRSILEQEKTLTGRMALWVKQRYGIDPGRYYYLSLEEIKKNSELELHTHRTGWIFKRKEGYPLLYIHTGLAPKRNSLWLEYKCKSEEQWNEAEQAIREAGVLAGEELCTPAELVEMRKGRFQHGKILKENGEVALSVQVDWKYVSIGF